MSKKLIIIVAAVLLIGGGGAGGYYHFFMAKKSKVANATPPPSPAQPKLAYVDVKEMTLRLADANSEHYIKLSPALGVPVAKSDEMTDKLPVVRDRIVTVVTAHTSQDLVTPAGKDKLKTELMAALHRDFKEDVVEIYFSDYLVE
jgi:flagellar FliL protein